MHLVQSPGDRQVPEGAKRPEEAEYDRDRLGRLVSDRILGRASRRLADREANQQRERQAREAHDEEGGTPAAMRCG